jgi:murein L,D-transpeptidase YcbB/YkuD
MALRFVRPIVSILFAGIFSSVGPVAAIRPPAASPGLVEDIRTRLRGRIGSPEFSGPVFCRDDLLCGSDVLPRFYRDRDFRPAWIDDSLRLPLARSFLSALSEVEKDGLNPENYHLAALRALTASIEERNARRSDAPDPSDWLDLEMLLTDAFLLCGSHLLHGQVEQESLRSNWFIRGRIEDLVAVLEKGLSTGEIAEAFDDLRPRHGIYMGLRSALEKFRDPAETSIRPFLEAGPSLRLGDSGPRVRVLNELLAAWGDLASERGGDDGEGKNGELFDERTEEAVRNFQERHGLEADGIAGESTRSELQVLVEMRRLQILANLERWRWIASDLGEPHILVNIPDFRVALYREGREVLSTKAIMGRLYRQTPVFSGRVTYLGVNPPWNIPPKLAREDILPKIKADPSFLRQEGIRVFEDWSPGAAEVDPDSVDWTRLSPGALAYKLVQDPGPKNALGRIAFMFPNAFDVYLHDTPAHDLFNRPARTFSSGCVRIEKSFELAEVLLENNPDWSPDSLRKLIDRGETRKIPLPHPVDIHVLYWTAWRDDGGRVNFRNDAYGRDRALYRALLERAPSAAE